MNQLKLNKMLLTTLAIGMTLTLMACGSGSSSSDRLAAGTVGTKGDGVNQAEFDAINGTMNRDQVIAIVGDGPTKDYGTALEWRSTDPYVLVFFNSAGLVREKDVAKTGVANPLTQVTY